MIQKISNLMNHFLILYYEQHEYSFIIDMIIMISTMTYIVDTGDDDDVDDDIHYTYFVLFSIVFCMRHPYLN
jgi:hypothetical protein